MAQRSKKRSDTSKSSLSDEDLDAWIGSAQPTTGCRTCKHAAAGTLRRLLTAMASRGSHNVTLRKLHAKLQDLHDDYRIGYWGFRDHLYHCEKELYAASKKARAHA